MRSRNRFARAVCLPAVIVSTGLVAWHSPVDAARTPPPGLSVSDEVITEGDSETMVFTVSIDAQPSRRRPVSVTVATGNGSALAESDFEFAEETLTFEQGGPLSRKLEVHILNDDEPEGDETFTVGLSNIRNANVLDGTGTGTIHDDDPAAPPPPPPPPPPPLPGAV